MHSRKSEKINNTILIQFPHFPLKTQWLIYFHILSIEIFIIFSYLRFTNSISISSRRADPRPQTGVFHQKQMMTNFV